MLQPTYADLIRPTEKTRALIYDAVLVLAGSLLMAALSLLSVSVPGSGVPITAQTLGVMLIGALLGWKRGSASMALFLAEGLAGLPVFAGAGAGFAYMTGPTAGYLVGFVMAAGLIGWLAERGWDRSPVKALVAMSVGHVLLFVPGVAWLAVLFGAEKAIAVGLTPFIAATLLKTALGAALMQASWMVVARRSQDRIDG